MSKKNTNPVSEAAFYKVFRQPIIGVDFIVYWAADHPVEIRAMLEELGLRKVYIDQYVAQRPSYGQNKKHDIIHPQDRFLPYANMNFIVNQISDHEINYRYLIGLSPLNNNIGTWAHEAGHLAISLIGSSWYSEINDDTEETVCRIIGYCTNCIRDAWNEYEKSPVFKRHKSYIKALKEQAEKESETWQPPEEHGGWSKPVIKWS